MKRIWNKIPYRYRAKIIEVTHPFVFCGLLFSCWLAHVLFFGWYHYLFKAEGYLIKASDILEDIDGPSHRWWSKHHCNAARKAAAMNDPDSVVLFTWRVHPFYLDNDILYVQSKGYSARIINDDEKIYRFR